MAGDDHGGACFARVRGRLRDCSNSEEAIADFVLSRPGEARNMSITEIAEACDTSPPTVSRFCKSLGYAGYRSFQLDLAASLVQEAETSLDDFDESASPEIIIRKVFECNRVSLGETEKVLDHEVMIEVAAALRDADRLIFLGIGGSGLVAQEGAERFLSLGKHALAVTDPYDQVFVTAAMGPADVVVCVSHTGQTKHVIEAAAQARKRGAKTVALTNYPQSPLAQTCEFTLVTAFREHRINAAISSSRIAQICVIDALYFVVGKFERKEATKIAAEAEARVQRMLRPSGGLSRQTGPRPADRNQ